jgi:hypothetical protein
MSDPGPGPHPTRPHVCLCGYLTDYIDGVELPTPIGDADGKDPLSFCLVCGAAHRVNIRVRPYELRLVGDSDLTPDELEAAGEARRLIRATIRRFGLPPSMRGRSGTA